MLVSTIKKRVASWREQGCRCLLMVRCCRIQYEAVCILKTLKSDVYIKNKRSAPMTQNTAPLHERYLLLQFSQIIAPFSKTFTAYLVLFDCSLNRQGITEQINKILNEMKQ
jgi:hypothetical protein